MQTSQSTAVAQAPDEGLRERKERPNNVTQEHQQQTIPRALEFSHCLPVHTKQSPSILSKDYQERLSFRGFGNLGSDSTASYLR